MKRHGEFVRLELPDLIRMNRLVRGRIDIEGFVAWHRDLDDGEGLQLIDSLVAYAGEAGFDADTYAEAMGAAGLDATTALAQEVASFWQPGWTRPDRIGLRKWLGGLDDDSREWMLRWAVFLFGTAEGRVYRNEHPASCNHWWHRDLTDERVVEALLNDPRYASTSMKDDAKFKRPWWRRF